MPKDDQVPEPSQSSGARPQTPIKPSSAPPVPINLQTKSLEELKDLYPTVSATALHHEIARRLRLHKGAVRNDVYQDIISINMRGLIGKMIPAKAGEEIAFVQWLCLVQHSETLADIEEEIPSLRRVSQEEWDEMAKEDAEITHEFY